ncbi:MAG: hypothetical protein R3A46_11255 [Thermomicrobiales bacterium]
MHPYTSFRERIENPGRFAADFALLMVALALFALAMVLSLQSDLGANSWTVFHHGISLQTPLTLGTAGIVVGLLILGASWAMGIKPGIGTVANMFFIGIWTDVYLGFDLIPKANWLPVQIVMLCGSAILLGFATALYIKTAFGAGPRDAFMLALTRHEYPDRAHPLGHRSHRRHHRHSSRRVVRHRDADLRDHDRAVGGLLLRTLRHPHQRGRQQQAPPPARPPARRGGIARSTQTALYR